MGVLNYTMWMLKYTLWDSQWASNYTPRVLLGQNYVLISVFADGACAQRPCYEMISTKVHKDGGGLWASATEPACTRQVELLLLSLTGSVYSVGSTVSAYLPVLQASTAPLAPPRRSKWIFPE